MSGEAPPPLTLEEAARIIARLERAVRENRIILIGGQAVALWSAQLERYLPPHFAPVTSRDVDFQGTQSDVSRAAELLGGSAELATMDDFTPQTGVATFLDSEGYERKLDFLAQPYGLDAEDVANTAIEVEIRVPGRTIPLWVMHPERCLRSRVANIALPNKQTPLAWEQLKAAILNLKAFSQFALDDGRAPKLVMKINERIHDLAYHDDRAMRLFAEHQIDVTDAVLIDTALAGPHLDTRLPQLEKRLSDKRARKSQAGVTEVAETIAPASPPRGS